MSDLTIGYKGHTGAWTGVVRDGKTIVGECGHLHRNRDGGNAPARGCIVKLAKAATGNEYLAGQVVADAARQAATARKLGARVDTEELVAAARQRIADLAVAIGDRPVLHYGRPLDAPLFPRY